MYKKIAVLVLVSLLFSACQKEQIPESTITLPMVNFNDITDTVSAVKENSAKKDISEYEDCTAVILNNTIEIAENPIFIFTMTPHADAKSGDSIDGLYHDYYSVGVVRGTIIDLTYLTDGHYGSTYYSFAVSEVLSGEQIKPETIITIQDEQGIVPLKLYRENVYFNAYPQVTEEDVDRTYLIESASEPFVEIGEEYVLFLSKFNRSTSNNIVGNWYFITYSYGGKFKRTEDGLYERMIPEFMNHIFKFTGSLSLEELKEQIAEAASKPK